MSTSLGSCSAVQKHVDRMARGRRMRSQSVPKQTFNEDIGDIKQWLQTPLALEDVRVGGHDMYEQILDCYKRQTARRMLHDFEASGLDEDLEELRAGWAPAFKHRQGFPQPRPPLLADLSQTSKRGAKPEHGRNLWNLDDEEDEEPRSVLAAQGERARERLRGLQYLRGAADVQKVPCTSTEPLCRDRNPMKERSAEGISSANLALALPTPKKSNGRSTSSDPWDRWEQRWSEEFKHFEEIERMRNFRRSCEDDEEKRQSEWKKKVEAAKAQTAEQRANPRRRNEAPPTPQRPSQFSAKAPTNNEAPKQSLPPPKPPPQKAQALPQFTSFAAFDAAWGAFEQRLSSGVQLSFTDIPWPDSLSSVSGVAHSDNVTDRKKKLRGALMRWHPDKWSHILERIKDTEKASVLQHVKEVTQRILEEKKHFSEG